MGVDKGTDDAADGKWMTYRELAEARGIDPPSALKLALRNKWRKQRDNHNVVRILVPVDFAARKDTSTSSGVDVRADMSRALSVLEGAIAPLQNAIEALGQRAEAAERRADQAEASADAHRDRADAAEATARVLQDRAHRAETAEAAAINRAENAESELARVREADQLRRARGVLARIRAAWRRE